MNLYRILAANVAFLSLVALSASAHEWHNHSHGDHQHSRASTQNVNSPDSAAKPMVEGVNTHPVFTLTAFAKEIDVQIEPDIARHFEGFKGVNTRWDSDTLFVESNGLPDHNMMVGIRSWQQQVPLPQPFTGNNAWQIPLKPQLSKNPVSARNNLYRGAIALAVNGVPIFNALNNRGEDAFLADELDRWGGHCGRGDDYHYHTAPVHLEEIVGKGNPIAFALDGFPIYGLTEADGSPVGKLDEYNGQFDEDGRYHYHATKSYPYINGGMRGVVTIRGDQIEPQPRDSPVRPAFQPLRGATITDFKTVGTASVLTYVIRGKSGTVRYSPVGKTSWKFTYVEPGRNARTETYQRRARRNDRGGKKPPPPPRRGGNRPPRR